MVINCNGITILFIDDIQLRVKSEQDTDNWATTTNYSDWNVIQESDV